MLVLCSDDRRGAYPCWRRYEGALFVQRHWRPYQDRRRNGRRDVQFLHNGLFSPAGAHHDVLEWQRVSYVKYFCLLFVKYLFTCIVPIHKSFAYQLQ